MASGGSPGLREIFQVLVIAEDLDGVSSSLQVHPSLFEGCNHCQQLLVVDGIVRLRRRELLGVEADRMEVPVC